MKRKISLEQERMELQRYLGRAELEFPHNDLWLRLDCLFLQQGYDIRQKEETYEHPAPPFCRLFVFFNRGGRVSLNGRVWIFDPGKFYLLPDREAFTVTYEAGSELLFFHVSVTDFSRMSVFAGAGQCLVLEDEPLAGVFAALRHQAWGAGLQAAALLALSRLAERNYGVMQDRTRTGAEFIPVFQALSEQPPGHIRIDQLAAEIGVSAAALAKSFRRKMGISLKSYLTRETVEKSQKMLLYGNQTVEDIARELGFNDSHYFHRYFRKHTGMSPTIYRATCRKNNTSH